METENWGVGTYGIGPPEIVALKAISLVTFCPTNGESPQSPPSTDFSHGSNNANSLERKEQKLVIMMGQYSRPILGSNLDAGLQWCAINS